MSRVVGRDALLEEVRALLARGESVALCGPTGVGKSALLDVIEHAAHQQHGAEVLRATGAADESALPFAALRDLLAQCPADLVAQMPDDVREVVSSGLVGLAATHERRSDLAAAVHALLEQWSTPDRPVLLLLDDVQWLDADSSAIVGYARRRLGGRVLVVATVGDTPASAERPGETELDRLTVDVSGLTHLDVPPLDPVDMLELLCSHGLRPDV